MNQLLNVRRKRIMPAVLPTSRYAFIKAEWHHEIVDQAHGSFLDEMKRRGVDESFIEPHEVPGAFEIPLLAQTLAETGKYSAVIACAFVVNGGIYRHEFVADAVIKGLMSVQLETGVPMISVVLTPRDFHEHDQHRRFFKEHFVVKGVEAASTCLKAVAKLRAVRTEVLEC